MAKLTSFLGNIVLDVDSTLKSSKYIKVVKPCFLSNLYHLTSRGDTMGNQCMFLFSIVDAIRLRTSYLSWLILMLARYYWMHFGLVNVSAQKKSPLFFSYKKTFLLRNMLS